MQEIEQLYEAHGAALLAYLQRSYGRYASAEDMLHDTFVQALRQTERVQAADSPRAWLFGIARHVGLTAARRRRPTQSLTGAEPREPAKNQNLAAMHEAIAELPSTLREPLELRLRENLSYEEIAQVLAIPIGTVRSRLHTTMHRLREALGVAETRSTGREQ